ncbi:MAG: hypothetical protein K8T90_11390 [Planctomycetes bacterium]|nr:hypothetical protein [Planctomycetota bacterium]
MFVRAATVVLLLAACGGPSVIRTPPDDRRPNVHRPVSVPPIDEMPGPGPAADAPPAASDSPVASAVRRPDGPPTVFEYAPFPMRAPTGVTGPVPYIPTPREEPFTWRIAGPVVAKMDDPVGTFVAWFGIVRGVEQDAVGGRTRVWVEGKYFDGATDPAVLCMDFNGGGDFVATLTGPRVTLIPLSLVHVYGTVTSREGGLARIAAEYVREWDWGEFRFVSARGEQRGSERWRKLCTVPIDDASMADPSPSPSYFIERLGARSSFLEERPEFPKD